MKNKRLISNSSAIGIALLITFIFVPAPIQASLLDWCKGFALLGKKKFTDSEAASITAKYTTLPPNTPIPGSSKIPEKLTYPLAVEYMDRAAEGLEPIQHVILALDFLGKNQIANKFLENICLDTPTVPEVIKKLEPEIHGLFDIDRKDVQVAGMKKILGMVAILRYSPALSPEIRQQIADGPYKTAAYLFGTRRAQIQEARMTYALRQNDPTLSDLTKFEKAFWEEFDKPADLGDPALVVKAYLPALITSPKNLGKIIPSLKQWYRHGVYGFEGTKPEEVQKRFQFEGSIEQLRRAIQALPNQTPEIKKSFAELDAITIIKSEAEAREILARMKANQAMRGALADEVAAWAQQLASPDPLVRADVGRRITHLIWKLEYQVEYSSDLSQKLAAAQALHVCTGQAVEGRLDP